MGRAIFDKALQQLEIEKLNRRIAELEEKRINDANEYAEIQAKLDAVRGFVQANDEWEVSAKEALKSIKTAVSKKALGENDD